MREWKKEIKEGKEQVFEGDIPIPLVTENKNEDNDSAQAEPEPAKAVRF